MLETEIVCIGAGPAGLTAAYAITKKGHACVVLEEDSQYVGGISRTVRYKEFLFDIGGHRFFSKSETVEKLWDEILPNDMLVRPRKSRIYYRNKFYSYPLRAIEALLNLGLWESTLCVLSYLKQLIFPFKQTQNLEEWVCNQFGRRLFSIFFKTYTEKVWGMKCTEISADWAAQRIKGLSLFSTIWNALKPKNGSYGREKVIKTLIESFRYPRRGPGMMWESACRIVESRNGKVMLGWKVNGLQFDRQLQQWIVSASNLKGDSLDVRCGNVISSAPLRDVWTSVVPRPVSYEAATYLRYRDFLTVTLIVKERNIFDDNWIYIHDPTVKVGRVQNFRSWSAEMVPDKNINCLGLEYFCFENDSFWSMSDEDLIELAKREIVQLNLVAFEDILEGIVVRQKKAYPIYDDKYQQCITEIRQEIAANYPGLHLVGRNGMHKYNNQDHAMMTALLTVENIFSEKNMFDVWQVNQDAEYLEGEKNNND